ncbi:hypothetical protein STRAU_3294 [Streptomyces aurantiacus JA 4570]|uniref:Uncharacterized protein n=1 Tax=Streptomyces aurantiacus JA 4570 TaxID=1286094 RepID=S3ZYZ4_9ACTN|nr:hypothetical protein STRAU_3294 [Streptomyces aurantiacus JA 4570]
MALLTPRVEVPSHPGKPRGTTDNGTTRAAHSSILTTECSAVTRQPATNYRRFGLSASVVLSTGQ